MSDTTQIDHVKVARNEIADQMSAYGFSRSLKRIEGHIDALAAERDALRRYATALERNGVANGTITRLRREHGVTELMARRDE